MNSTQDAPIKTAVVTGEHPFDVPGFQAVFRGIPSIDFYPQHLDDFVADWGQVRRSYDVVLFYNFHQRTPGAQESWWNQGMRVVLEELGSSTQGIFVLHHAILAFPQWQLWSDICGIQDRSFVHHPDETVRIDVAAPGHPITPEPASWTIVDETYTMDEPAEGSNILLTTANPRSMAAIAWTRQYGQSRVFCFQSGHDNRVFADPGFRTIVARGIAWSAGRI